MKSYSNIIEKGHMREFFEVIDGMLERDNYVTQTSDTSKIKNDKRFYLRNFKVYFDNISYYAEKNNFTLSFDSEKNGTRREFYLIALNLDYSKPIVAEIGFEGIQKPIGYAYKRKDYYKEKLIYAKSILDSYDEKNITYESDIKDIERFFLKYINSSTMPLESLKQVLINNFFTVLKYSQYDKNFYKSSYFSEFIQLEIFVKEMMKKGINIDDIIHTVRNLFVYSERKVKERK